jgi:hypothetical protein
MQNLKSQDDPAPAWTAESDASAMLVD